MRDPKAFKFLSDHEGDKIIYFYEGSFDATMRVTTITHDLGFAPLLIGYWSTNANFSDSRAFSSIGITDMQGNDIFDEVNCNTRGNSDIVISLLSKVGSYDRVYFRLFGFMPTTVSATVPQTATLANGNFIFNTRYKYSKLYAEGTATGSVTIDHNFGYLPRVLAWRENTFEPAAVSQISLGQPQSIYSSQQYGIIVSDSSVIIRSAISNSRIHYRIYYDEA